MQTNPPVSWPPDAVPVLARGKHRSPRKGACFMELVSYLAGERWSDHPSCTHPLLAALARDINDYTSDAGRCRLAPLIPSVIGLTSSDPRINPRIALLAATTALPVVSEERQRILAVGILRCERDLALADGRSSSELSSTSRQALDQVPFAARWAREFVQSAGRRGLARPGRAYLQIVRCAAEGIAEACIRDPDRMLCQLLADTIDGCHRWMDTEPSPEHPSRDRPHYATVGAASR